MHARCFAQWLGDVENFSNLFLNLKQEEKRKHGLQHPSLDYQSTNENIAIWLAESE